MTCPQLSASKWQSQDSKPHFLVLRPRLFLLHRCSKIVYFLYLDFYILLTKYAEICLILSGLYESINTEAYINPQFHPEFLNNFFKSREKSLSCMAFHLNKMVKY